MGRWHYRFTTYTDWLYTRKHKGVVFRFIHSWFSTPVLGTHCCTYFVCLAYLKHLIQLNRVFQIKETYKMCRALGLQDQDWEPPEGPTSCRVSSHKLDWTFLLSLKSSISWFRCVYCNFGNIPFRNMIGHHCSRQKLGSLGHWYLLWAISHSGPGDPLLRPYLGASQTEDCIHRKLHISAATSSKGHLNRKNPWKASLQATEGLN